MKYTLELQPVDTLFFRDARPMQAGAGSGGHGATWPLPNVAHEALRAMLLKLSGTENSGKTAVSYRSTPGGYRKRSFVTPNYESLRTLGPFPVRNGKVYFPAPSDLIANGEDQVSLLSPTDGHFGANNFPVAWLQPVAAKTRAGKIPRFDWVSRDYFEQYLGAGQKLQPPAIEALFHSENRIGITIDPRTRTAEEGKLYASEHLRLAQDVRLWLLASLSQKDAAFRTTKINLEDCIGRHLTIGGESRMCRILAGADGLLDNMPKPAGLRIKWVLVTQAVFRKGWLPNWIRERDGAVLLKSGDTRRRTGEDRKTWRERVRALPQINARLVAACVSQPICFSGWDLAMETVDDDGASRLGGPKPTMYAAPAGSVYYLEAASNPDAGALIESLQGRTRSDFFGEKGMGMGFCGIWEPF